MKNNSFKDKFVTCVFGDSIAYGTGNQEKTSWVIRLREFLEKSSTGKGKFHLVYNCSVSGDTTNDLLKRFETECKARKPNLIIFAIGLNDTQFFIKENKFNVELKLFKENLETLINLAEKCAQRIIFVGLTPVDEKYTVPLSRDSNRMCKNDFIEKYNSTIRRITRNFKFVDIFEKWTKIDYRSFLADGLHPNEKGHDNIYENVTTVLKGLGFA
jgi:lysophospholipase L1-like esterase